jgi:hypothetical protein
VWELGADYFPATPKESWDRSSAEFRAIDWGVAGFLRRDRYPRIQWTDSVPGDPEFARLRGGLVSGDPVVQLQALVVLVRSGTSANVREQWRVAQELRDKWTAGTREQALVSEVLKCFDQEQIKKWLPEPSEPPLDGAGPRSVLWLVGARGCARSADAVEDLRRYALHLDSDVAVAGVEALRSIDSHESRRALMAVVKQGVWPAASCAAEALGRQAPEMLRRIVSDTDVAPEGRWAALTGLIRDATVGEICRRALALEPGHAEWAEGCICRWIVESAAPADTESVRTLALYLGERGALLRALVDRFDAANRERADR